MKSLIIGGLSAIVLMGLGPWPTVAKAQVFSSQRNRPNSAQTSPTQVSPRQGTNAPAVLSQDNTATLQTRLEQSDTLYLDKDNTYSYDLVLRAVSSVGGRRLPVGTVVRGQFEPAEGGLVYRASSVEVADRIYRINASSELLRDRKDPRQTSTGAILTDAAIGAAGGYVLGEVLGDSGLLEVLGGAATGVVVGNTTAPFVVVVSPEDAITLTTN